MTSEDYKRAIDQLEALKDHCGDMIDEADPDDIWTHDVWALEIAIEALKYKEERSHYHSELEMIMDKKKISDEKWKKAQESWKKHEECLNHKSCSTCDRFGIDCGTCEVANDE